MIKRRLAAAIAAFGLTLMLIAPALAVEINQTLPISSADFGVNTTGDCHGSPGQGHQGVVVGKQDKPNEGCCPERKCSDSSHPWADRPERRQGH